MTFAEYKNKSVSQFRTLVQFDYSRFNDHWINAGAGIWYVNFKNLYPEVDESLLDGFVALDINDVGSVQMDGTFLTEVFTTVAMPPSSFYFDLANSELYITMSSYDDPLLHEVFIGAILGYSYKEFTPVGSPLVYEGRLTGGLNITKSRDPLYFGKISYDISNINLINSDGFFDMFGENNKIFGNEVRVYIGYAQLDISDYELVYTGVTETFSVDEKTATFTVSDKRKTLSKEVSINETDTNALEVIENMLLAEYGITYDATNYDTTAWAAAKALVPNISLVTYDKWAAQDVIERICTSVFGIFDINREGKYTFKLIDTSGTSVTAISRNDLLNPIVLDYNPSEVISSIRVGYAPNFNPEVTDSLTWLLNTDYETEVYNTYKVYAQHDFETLLDTLTTASILSGTLMNYVKDIHASFSNVVPIKYFDLIVGDVVDIDINRQTVTMLGTKKCEILSIEYDLFSALMTIKTRVV